MFGESATKGELMILRKLLVTYCEFSYHAMKNKVTARGVSDEVSKVSDLIVSVRI